MKFKKEKKIEVIRLEYKSNNANQDGVIFKPLHNKKGASVVFIHGHASDAWKSSYFGYLLATQGFNAFLPSQRGYGFSEGAPDFCGPKTVASISRGVKIFLDQSFVDKERVGVWGISRGATVAAQLLVKNPEIFKVGVLQSGAYEMKINYETTKIQGIKNVIKKEAGTTRKSFSDRSPIYGATSIACPILILHGKNDERILVQQAELLDRKLNELKKEHKTVILENDHFLTKSTWGSHTLPFLKKYLLK